MAQCHPNLHELACPILASICLNSICIQIGYRFVCNSDLGKDYEKGKLYSYAIELQGSCRDKNNLHPLGFGLHYLVSIIWFAFLPIESPDYRIE